MAEVKSDAKSALSSISNKLSEKSDNKQSAKVDNSPRDKYEVRPGNILMVGQPDGSVKRCEGGEVVLLTKKEAKRHMDRGSVTMHVEDDDDGKGS